MEIVTTHRRQALLACVTAVLVVGFLELTLAVLASASTRVSRLLSSPAAVIPPTIPDARLGHRPTPGAPGHDARGFRNESVPAAAYAVALGDSQTHGASTVEPRQAWPRQLEEMIGRNVYSMAYGGYGPTHSVLLWPEAETLSPQVVIEAFYAGNDLFDAFSHVYTGGQLSELRTAEPAVEAAVRRWEAAEPIARRVERMFHMGASPTPAGAAGAAPGGGGPPRRWLSAHSKLYGLFRRGRHELARRMAPPASPLRDPWDEARSFAASHPDHCQIFSQGPFRTVFTSEYRLTALDLGDPRIDEGLRIALRAIERLHASAAGRRFLVVMIPTKESVFRTIWKDPPPASVRLMENEELVWSTAKEHFERHGIEHLDALPALREVLGSGVQPYPVSYDGHPNEHGHRAIARMVAEALRRPEGPGAPSGGGTTGR
ncbi:MAG TPA: SGNH/GDSL hydrolase family protein [Candidatus Polarisedimenticolia bacterium]|nr:SGNH/GDSL hydrolase family protein [Candidatus Polarisedimenticolia bacterium]